MRQRIIRSKRKRSDPWETHRSVLKREHAATTPLETLFPYEVELAVRFARLKILLGVATILVVYVDRTVPYGNRTDALQHALLSALVFCLYTIASYVALRREVVSSGAYRVWTPPLDAIFATYLISTTNGHNSPFVQLLSLALVGTVLSPHLITSVLTTLLAFGGLFITAATSGAAAKDVGTIAGRSLLIFAVAVLTRFVSAMLVRYAHHLTVSSRFGAEMASLSGRSQAMKRFQETLDTVPGGGKFKIVLSDEWSDGSHPAVGTHDRVWPLQAGNTVFGFCIREGKQPPGAGEAWLIGDLSERFSTFLQRTALTDELIAAMVREERLRLADEMHDGYLQTLAAIGFSAEAARTVVAPDSPALPALAEISQFSNEGALRARTFLREAAERPIGGLKVLRDEFRLRWRRAWSIEASDLVAFSEGEWRAAQMLIREGAANAERHGQAQNLKLVIHEEAERVVLELYADGKEPPREISFGYGLKRLAAVAAEHAGRLYLSPSGYGGSVLTLIFPRNNGHSSPPR